MESVETARGNLDVSPIVEDPIPTSITESKSLPASTPVSVATPIPSEPPREKGSGTLREIGREEVIPVLWLLGMIVTAAAMPILMEAILVRCVVILLRPNGIRGFTSVMV